MWEDWNKIQAFLQIKQGKKETCVSFLLFILGLFYGWYLVCGLCLVERNVTYSKFTNKEKSEIKSHKIQMKRMQKINSKPRFNRKTDMYHLWTPRFIEEYIKFPSKLHHRVRWTPALTKAFEGITKPQINNYNHKKTNENKNKNLNQSFESMKINQTNDSFQLPILGREQLMSQNNNVKKMVHSYLKWISNYQKKIRKENKHFHEMKSDKDESDDSESDSDENHKHDENEEKIMEFEKNKNGNKNDIKNDNKNKIKNGNKKLKLNAKCMNDNNMKDYYKDEFERLIVNKMLENLKNCNSHSAFYQGFLSIIETFEFRYSDFFDRFFKNSQWYQALQR